MGNIQSHNSTQRRQYWPNSFHSTYKSLDNISMGEMVDGFDGLQRWRLLDSDRHYTMQKLAEVIRAKHGKRRWFITWIYNWIYLWNLFILINWHLTNVFLAWFDPIRQQDCIATVRSSALLARDLLVRRDGSAQVAPQEGRFFGGKQLKKESISAFYLK